MSSEFTIVLHQVSEPGLLVQDSEQSPDPQTVSSEKHFTAVLF